MPKIELLARQLADGHPLQWTQDFEVDPPLDGRGPTFTTTVVAEALLDDPLAIQVWTIGGTPLDAYRDNPPRMWFGDVDEDDLDEDDDILQFHHLQVDGPRTGPFVMMVDRDDLDHMWVQPDVDVHIVLSDDDASQVAAWSTHCGHPLSPDQYQELFATFDPAVHSYLVAEGWSADRSCDAFEMWCRQVVGQQATCTYLPPERPVSLDPPALPPRRRCQHRWLPPGALPDETLVACGQPAAMQVHTPGLAVDVCHSHRDLYRDGWDELPLGS